MATAAPVKVITDHTSAQANITIYSQSSLFFWWPIWVVRFLMLNTREVE